MYVGTRLKLSALDKVKNRILINSTVVNCVKKCKNLGLIIDQNLNFTDHVNKLVQISYYKLKTLYRYKQFLPANVKLKLMEALIISRLDYCDVVYGPRLSVADAYKLQKIQNSCIRYVYNVTRREHVSPFYALSKWPRLSVRRNIHLCLLTHKILCTGCPEYLRDKLRFRSEVHSVNIRGGGTLDTPRHSTATYTGSFSYAASHVYNNLPGSLKQLSLNAFKNNVKLYLTQHQ